MEVEVRGPDGEQLADRSIGKIYVRGQSVMVGYFRDEESTSACLSGDGWLDTGDMGYMSGGYIFIVGRAKDMIIINGRNYWPQDIEWAVEQLPGFKSGDIAAFAITGPSGEETPAVLVHCRVSDPAERGRLRDDIRQRVHAITGISPVVELVPPRTLPRTSSGKLSRTKARSPLSVGRNRALRYRCVNEATFEATARELGLQFAASLVLVGLMIVIHSVVLIEASRRLHLRQEELKKRQFDYSAVMLMVGLGSLLFLLHLSRSCCSPSSTSRSARSSRARRRSITPPPPTRRSAPRPPISPTNGGWSARWRR